MFSPSLGLQGYTIQARCCLVYLGPLARGQAGTSRGLLSGSMVSEYTSCLHRVSYTRDITILPCPSGRCAFGNAGRWTLGPLLSNHDPNDPPPGLNLIVDEKGRLNVSLSHDLPTMTRRISI